MPHVRCATGHRIEQGHSPMTLVKGADPERESQHGHSPGGTASVHMCVGGIGVLRRALVAVGQAGAAKGGRCACAWVRAGLSLRDKNKTFVTPTETNVHGDAFCFVVMGPPLLQRLAVGGW